MTLEDRFFLVATDTVLNHTGTGYRGVYRASPTTLLFTAERINEVMGLLERLDEDDRGRFLTIEGATEAAALSREYGLACEILECQPLPVSGDVHFEESVDRFLGFDVAQPFGGGYSAIVDRCMRLWLREWANTVTVAEPPYTLRCISEFFSSKLNKYRLFDDLHEARMFHHVDRECAKHFGGETSCETTIVAVNTVLSDS